MLDVVVTFLRLLRRRHVPINNFIGVLEFMNDMSHYEVSIYVNHN